MAIKNFPSPIKEKVYTAFTERIDDIIVVTIIEGKYNDANKIDQIIKQKIEEERVSPPFLWFFAMYKNDAKEFANQILKLCEAE